MKYLSVCSGIEAATVAWHHMGWQPVAFSDIEPFPSAVLAHHYPNVPNLGDMTKFEEWNLEPINLLVGGTPCQSFSVAGLRKGLADPRGNLMLTFLAIAQRQRPQWIVWENVPGVLSSNGGRDFGTFLGALGELGYGFAYRVLDAQWFGVAQRRRRVFVVGYLGDWQRPAAVLFERESVRRDTPPSREAGQDVAGTIAARFGISRNNHEECVAQTLLARRGGFDLESETPVVAPTLQANDGAKWGSNQWIDEGKAIVQPVAFHNRQDPDVSGHITHPLGANDNGMAVAQPINIYGGNKRPDRPEGGFYVRTDETTSKTLDAASGLNPTCSQGGTAVMTAMQVRRLTPVECERLQGFPDNYTNIPWRKKPESPDGPRYKALGNSMAVPVMRWIGERINKVDAE
jgi:DNA (cytosine-5)-methyltransferase 1